MFDTLQVADVTVTAYDDVVVGEGVLAGGVTLVLALVAVPDTPALSAKVTVTTTDVISVLKVAALSVHDIGPELAVPPAVTADENALVNVQLPLSPVRENCVFTDEIVADERPPVSRTVIDTLY